VETSTSTADSSFVLIHHSTINKCGLKSFEKIVPAGFWINPQLEFDHQE
jgi:hypothetical protein